MQKTWAFYSKEWQSFLAILGSEKESLKIFWKFGSVVKMTLRVFFSSSEFLLKHWYTANILYVVEDSIPLMEGLLASLE